MSTDRDYISHYRTQVQQLLMLGANEGRLKQREFEYLAERIEQSSGIRLSISTLKRLWRDDLTQLPHPSTLNALVAVLNYGSWAEFKAATAIVPGASVAPVARSGRKVSIPFLWVSASLLVLVAGFIVLQGFNNAAKAKLVLPANIPFSADKTVTSGVPNTVEFNYDVSGISADSFFIQQSWNPKNKVAIDPGGHYLSSIYYLPGFHRAKLIVNDSIVKTSRIHIKTNGWFAVAEYRDGDGREPFYLASPPLMYEGALHATGEFLASSGVDIAKRYQLRYYNIRDFENITSDNFTLEANIKMDSTKNTPCPLSQVVIVAEENIFYLQLTSKGCVGELSLKMGETVQRAKNSDLSAFGRNMYQWQALRIENVNRQVQVFLGSQPVHHLAYTKDFGKIVGIVFSFNSPGAIDDVRLLNDRKEPVYEEQF